MGRMHRLIGFSLIGVTSAVFSAERSISICTDTNFWYPFSFIKDKAPAGLHIDIIRQALKKLGFEPHFTPLPWNQCLSEVKAGHFDAVATVSYKPDRAAFLRYPAGADQAIRSPWRVTQVDYRVITYSKTADGKPNPYSFKGDIQTIPAPVRIPSGYSIIDNLKRAGLTVEEAPNSIDNFKKLKKTPAGSVIDLWEVAEYFSKDPAFRHAFVISPKPIFSRSYYLAFSKKGTIQPETAEAIWKEIARTRADTRGMAILLKQY